jgi:hypothetical protein
MSFPRPAAASRDRVVRETTHTRRYNLLGGGTAGNEQLTAIAGVLLLILFAVLGVTIIRIGQLLWLHLFLGVLLVGPVALKLGTTGYRFTRYYTSNPPYKQKGPPHPVLRMLAPFVILTTVVVFFTGLLLLLDGPSAPGTVRLAHKVSFFAWLAAVGVHVLGHLAELPRALRAVSTEHGYRRPLPGAVGRGSVVIGAIVIGLVLAMLFLPDVNAWTATGGAQVHHHLYVH